ncbi:chromate resistance protein ChrB domain-containing protein [Planctomycetota bacterium]
MKWLVVTGLVLAAGLSLFWLTDDEPVATGETDVSAAGKLYVSWDTMEFDKCVAGWLICRYLDPEARFQFIPKDAIVPTGIPFDIPGADWSRKHRKSTAQCVLEQIPETDPAVAEIVARAARVELSFWQLDRWPETEACFRHVESIINETSDSMTCFNMLCQYFDQLYDELRAQPMSPSSPNAITVGSGDKQN